MQALDKKFETIFKLDTFKLEHGWESVKISNPRNFQGCQYGVVPLVDFNSKGKDVSEILIFGGIGGSSSDVTDRSAIVRINNNDFS